MQLNMLLLLFQEIQLQKRDTIIMIIFKVNEKY